MSTDTDNGVSVPLCFKRVRCRNCRHSITYDAFHAGGGRVDTWCRCKPGEEDLEVYTLPLQEGDSCDTTTKIGSDSE